MRSPEMSHAYVQVALAIMESHNTEDREHCPLEKVKDNCPEYIVTQSNLMQHRSGIEHVNALDFMIKDGTF